MKKRIGAILLIAAIVAVFSTAVCAIGGGLVPVTLAKTSEFG